MIVNRKIYLLLVFVLGSFWATAQINAAKPKPVKDTIQPKLIVQFGPYKDSSKTLVPAAKQILKNELKITDAKGGIYKVVKFSFAWRRKDLTDDFKTGIPRTIFIYNETSVMGDAHIPASWQKELQGALQSKEELYFYDILAQHSKTKKLVKPASLRLLIL
ncbi:MAG: hypothetical protein V4717_10005 [Bacteroidota bacterium]